MPKQHAKRKARNIKALCLENIQHMSMLYLEENAKDLS